MLKILSNMADVSLPSLLQVYTQSNTENAGLHWPDLPGGLALEMAEQEFARYLREIFFKTPGAFYAVWEENGRYVSALRMEPYRDGLLLEALETAPEERGKGYARKLLQGVLEGIGGQKVYSHVGKRNAPSLAVHARCGFQILQEHAVFLDGSVDCHSRTLCYFKTTTE